MSKRQVTEWTEREFVINRYNIWFGSQMPKTISAKEIIDNGIDQAADNIAKNVSIHITKNSVAVIDDGKGISTEITDSGKSHLFLAVNKLYTSSNYDGTDGLAGTNGVGATATNALSEKFIAGYIDKEIFTGYIFENGVHDNEGEALDIIKDISNFNIKSIDKGFYVEANYNKEVLEDDINITWLLDYIKARVGELSPDTIITVTYEIEDSIFKEIEDNGITKNTNEIIGTNKRIETKIYNKIKGSDNYVNSWLEGVEDVPTAKVVHHRDGWSFAFCEDGDNFDNMNSIVQGAPVQNPKSVNIPFEIEELKIPVRVPVTFFYRGKINPPYTDQTKSRVTMRRARYYSSLKSNKDIYRKYLEKAEADYLKKVAGDNKSSMYHPATGNKYKELIVSEGYSAISGIMGMRSAKTQACFALRGKLLNVMQKDIRAAMKSDVVRDFISIITANDFDKIIITPDADADGAHICTLLLGVLARYGKEYLINGKVFYCKTPLYVFEKGPDMKWSDKVADRPKGYSLSVKKGLGSLTSRQIETLITNPNTRELYRFSYDDDEDYKSLEFALITGGKGWIAG